MEKEDEGEKRKYVNQGIQVLLLFERRLFSHPPLRAPAILSSRRRASVSRIIDG